MKDLIVSILWRFGWCDEAIHWNPGNKLVQCHRSGVVYWRATNWCRKKKGLPVPWTEEIGYKEIREPAVL